ncbi:MAG TPA: ATP-binding protein [Pyrinomonadaceae bacterium]|jgi:two-component system sensor histidine kinase CpxA
MSLFLKIFLWFWFSIALVVAALTIVNWSTQTEPLVRQWQIFVGEAVNTNSQTAIQIYENEGQKGLEEYLSRVGTSDRINAIGVFDENLRQIAGSDVSAEARELMTAALQSGNVEFNRLPDQIIAAKRVPGKKGANYVFAIQYKRPPSTSLLTEVTNRIPQILAVILTGGLLCYGLARYLSSPIGKLRKATQKFAEGDLQTRVATEVGNRHDELAYLARDFDEMAERIENLLDSQKRLSQDISHELRSPLARLNVALELAKQKSVNEATAPILERIEMESNRLNEMIGRLLMLSKLESGAQDFNKQNINLTKLVEAVAADADFEALAKGKSVKILENQNLRVFGNENLLRSAIENVLRNAVRYTKEGTTVEVSLSNGKGKAEVAVRDFGGGVPEDELENLFRPFYRVGEARERKTGGIGLGLAIAERAVHAHKGTIKATNTENGLRVVIKLPVSEN